MFNTAALRHDRSWGSRLTTSLTNLHTCKTNPLHSLQFLTKVPVQKILNFVCNSQITPLYPPFSDHELEKISYHLSGFLKYFVTFSNGWRSTVSTQPQLALIPREDLPHALTKRPCGSQNWSQNWSKTQSQIEKSPFLNATEPHFSSQPAQILTITLPILIKPRWHMNICHSHDYMRSVTPQMINRVNRALLYCNTWKNAWNQTAVDTLRRL